MRSHPAYRHVIRFLLVATVITLIFQVSEMWRTTKYNAPGVNDFLEYWSSGQLLLQGKNPWDFDELDRIQSSYGARSGIPVVMFDPPWALLWFMPLLILPLKRGVFVWMFANLGLLLACGTIIWRLLAPAGARRHIAVAWIAAAVFYPGLINVRMGQVSALLLVGVLGFFYCVEKDRPFPGGMFLALTTLKPHVLYLFWIAVAWWVITKRQWRVIVGTAAPLVVSLIALTAISPAWLTGYLGAFDNPPMGYDTPTIGSILRVLIFRDWPGAQFLPGVVGALLFLGYLLIKRPQLRWRNALSPLLLASIATAPYAWTFDSTLLLVPHLQILSWVVDDKSQMRPQRRWSIAGALLCIEAIMMMANRLRFPELLFFWGPWALAAVYMYAQARMESEA